ncbi:MAG: TIGR03943 family protein [Actinobacteria bacterium]|nr:TIGR03943 family protein [Actinomycetota bacterium]
MDERTQGALLLAVGGITIRLGVTDAALAYVKPGIQPLLAVAGGFLVVIGLLTVIRAFRGKPDELDLHGHADHGHGHQPGHGPAVAWLLTLPLLALLLIAPPPLGAFAASRQSDRPPAVTGSDFGPLPEPAADGAIPMKVSEYVYRALYDEQESLKGKTVRLTGFVTTAEEPGAAFQLTRFMLACCAADGQAVNVVVRTDQPAPPVDTWLELDGTWVEREGHETGELTLTSPLIQATSFRQIEQPAQPYE